MLSVSLNKIGACRTKIQMLAFTLARRC